MTQPLKHAELPGEHRAAEYLANERTFLAWIRTSLAIFSLGFVVAGAWRYHAVNRAIERGNFSADRGLVVLLTVIVTLLCLAMIGYLMLTAANT